MKTIDELKGDIVSLEHNTRMMRYNYDNLYADAHLQEINILAQAMLVQLSYTELALKGERTT